MERDAPGSPQDPDRRRTVVFTGASTSARSTRAVFPGESGEAGARPWRDTDVQIEGPVVAEFQKLFLETWQLQNGADLPERNYFPPLKAAGTPCARGRQFPASPTGSRSSCTSPPSPLRAFAAPDDCLFCPDEETVAALRAAAGRGVDVKLVLPGTTDAS